MENALIEKELFLWCEQVMVYSLCLALLQLAYYSGLPYVVILTPLGFLYLKRLLMTKPSRDTLYDVIENFFGFIFVCLGVLYAFQVLNFFFLLIPSSLDIVSAFIVSRKKNSCQFFSKILCGSIKYTQLVSLLMIGLKVNDLIEIEWYSVFWGVIVLIIFLIFLSIVYLCLLLSFLYGEAPSSLGFLLWLFYFIASYTGIIIYLLSTIRNFLENNSSSFMPACLSFILNSLLFIVLTVKFKSKLVNGWIEMLQNNETSEGKPSLVLALFKTYPKYLAKISPTFYKPVEADFVRKAKKTKTENKKKAKKESVSFMSHSLQDIKRDEISLDISEIVHNNCLVCFEEDANAILMECGHGGLCYECALALLNTASNCHICRCPISEILKIHQEGKHIAEIAKE